MPQLNTTSNPDHARIAGWLNVWPDHVALNPLPSGVNLYPLEQALRLAGQHIQPPLEGPAWWEWWWHKRGN